MRTLCLSQSIGVLLIHTEDIIQSCLKVQGKITMATHSYMWCIFIMNICNAMQYCRQRMNLMETVGYKIVIKKYCIIFFWCLKPFLVLVYDPLHYVNLCNNALQYKLQFLETAFLYFIHKPKNDETTDNTCRRNFWQPH